MMLIEYKMGWALAWLYGEGAISIVLMFVVGYWLHQRRRAGLESRQQTGAFDIVDNTFKV